MLRYRYLHISISAHAGLNCLYYECAGSPSQAVIYAVRYVKSSIWGQSELGNYLSGHSSISRFVRATPVSVPN